MLKQHPNISIFTKFLTMKCAFQSDIIFLHRNEVANMALYEIKNYIKLLCIRIDHIESYVVDEVNYSRPTLFLEFGASQSISLMRQVYLGYLDSSCRSHSQTFIENESNRLVVVNDNESPDALQTDSYMHKLLNLNK